MYGVATKLWTCKTMSRLGLHLHNKCGTCISITGCTPRRQQTSDHHHTQSHSAQCPTQMGPEGQKAGLTQARAGPRLRQPRDAPCLCGANESLLGVKTGRVHVQTAMVRRAMWRRTPTLTVDRCGRPEIHLRLPPYVWATGRCRRLAIDVRGVRAAHRIAPTKHIDTHRTQPTATATLGHAHQSHRA